MPANTEVDLPGVGTPYLRRVLRSGSEVEVRMIELVLTSPSAGPPVGADLQVAVAAVSLH